MSNNFTFETSVFIEYDKNIYQYDLKAQNTIQFRCLESGLAIQLSETNFFQKLSLGQIKIVNSTDYGFDIVSENNNDIRTKQSSIKGKHEERALFKQRVITKLEELGITQGQRKLIKNNIKIVVKKIRFESPALSLFKIPSSASVCRWWKLYIENSRDYLSLIPKHAYRKSEVRLRRLPSETWKIVEEIVNSIYLNPKRNSIATTHREIKLEIYKQNKHSEISSKGLYVICSSKTVERYIHSIPIEERYIARYGKEESRKKLRMVKGRLHSEHALDIVEIDGTPLDLFLIDSHTLLPLGRPTIIFVVDRYSRIILGLYISFEYESTEAVFNAIKTSLYPTGEINKLFPNIQNEWVWGGLGNTYTTDNAAVYTGHSYQRAITRMGSNFKLEKMGMAWLRGCVERTIRSNSQLLITGIPGKTFSRLFDRKNYNPEKDAILTMDQFTEVIYTWIADVYHQQPIGETGPTRNELWLEGTKYHPPSYPNDTSDLNQILGTSYTTTLNHLGVTQRFLHWASSDLEKIRASSTKYNPKIEWIMNTSDLSQIHIISPETGEYIPIPSTRPEYTNGLTLFQHELNITNSKEHSKNSRITSFDQIIDAQIRIKELMSTFAEENSLKKRQLAARYNKTSSFIDNKTDPKPTPTQRSANWGEVDPYDYV